MNLRRHVGVFPNPVTGNTGGLRCKNISKMVKRNEDSERILMIMMIILIIIIIRIGLT